MRAPARRAGLALGLTAGLAIPTLAAQAPRGGPAPGLAEPDFLLSVGEIVDPGRVGAAVVLGTEGELELAEQSLTVSDRLYVPAVLDGVPLAPADAVQLFRLDRTIFDPSTGAAVGRLLLPTGIGRVDSLAGAVARVVVTDAFRPILLGDGVRRVAAADTLLQAPGPTAGRGPVEGHVVGFQEEKAVHPPYDVLFLGPPTGADLAQGETLLLYRPGRAAAGLGLPDVAIGRATVVRRGEAASAAVLVEAYRSDLGAGDRYRREAPER